MKIASCNLVCFVGISCGQNGCSAFCSVNHHVRLETSIASVMSGDRRAFLVAGSVASLTALHVPLSHAVDDPSDDLTSKMFNEDGSLKDASIETEAKFRTVEIFWDASDTRAIAIDGENVAGTPKGSSFRLSYQLPEKWGLASDLYQDRSVGSKACDRITVYQANGTPDPKILEKASTIGIAKALDVFDDLVGIRNADMIGGSTKAKNGHTYFEFDMGAAPATCESSKENLGLGFCPYESIYLLSSTVIEERLYVFALQSDKSEWKRSNSDLRRVRSSFSVQRM
jgi:hypothetical protein